MGRTSGLCQAEGQRTTTAASTDLVTIYKIDSNTGQFSPRDITVANLLTGGSTGYTQGSIPFAGASGDLEQDNTNLNFNDSTNTLSTNKLATSGDYTATTGNIILATAGKGVQIKEGSNARMGTATLVSGTVTISNTSITANTRIFLSRYSVNSSTALGLLSVGTVTASTSFVINSLKEADATVQTNDVSIVHWILVEPTA
jgi:hypothetical protein